MLLCRLAVFNRLYEQALVLRQKLDSKRDRLKKSELEALKQVSQATVRQSLMTASTIKRAGCATAHCLCRLGTGHNCWGNIITSHNHQCCALISSRPAAVSGKQISHGQQQSVASKFLCCCPPTCLWRKAHCWHMLLGRLMLEASSNSCVNSAKCRLVCGDWCGGTLQQIQCDEAATGTPSDDAYRTMP